MSGWIRGAVLRAGLSLLGALWSGGAAADDGALAEALFREAQALMADGHYDDACPKFEESQRLDPTTGTLLNLAVCHEKTEKLASAWNEFNAAVVAARRDQRPDRVAFALEHIAAIESRLSLLIIELPQTSDAQGLEMRLDDTLLGRPAIGVAFPVDVGVHTLSVQAPKKVPWIKQLTILPGPSRQAVSIPRLEDVPQAQQRSDAAAVHPPDEAGRGSTQRLVAYVLGGAGIVGLGIGTGFGIAALVKFGESNDNGCDENACDSEGAALRDAARQAGDISTVAFISGSTLLVSGLVVYFTAPRRRSVHGPKAQHSRSVGFNGLPGGGVLNMEVAW